jgi:UDP-3-O-[3-hydroxymyristoyl] glucosamine N-acyltransferase
MRSISSKQITEASKDVLQLKTNLIPNLTFDEVRPAESALPTSLVFAADLKLFTEAIEKKVLGLIVKDSIFSEIQNLITNQHQVWTTTHIQQAMTLVLPFFDKKQEFLKPGIHPTASIHPMALIDSTAHIGAFAVIEAFAVVGADTIIYPHAYIGAYCTIGKRCVIAPHATIGFDGFGFSSDKDYKHTKIPQIGRVVIEDDCEIGAQCAIDRATLTETKIRRGTKIDNYCHIAHNVEIGENSMITAGFIVAGSTKIGRNFTTAGGVHVNGHVTITDNVILTGRAGATNDVSEPGMYGGFPLETHKESLKTLVSIPQIKNIRKQVKKILKHLNLNEE